MGDITESETDLEPAASKIKTIKEPQSSSLPTSQAIKIYEPPSSAGDQSQFYLLDCDDSGKSIELTKSQFAQFAKLKKLEAIQRRKQREADGEPVELTLEQAKQIAEDDFYSEEVRLAARKKFKKSPLSNAMAESYKLYKSSCCQLFYGRKDEEGLHHGSRYKVASILLGEKKYFPQKPTHQTFYDHLLGRDTIFYVSELTWGKECQIIMCIDIDCHDGVGTLEGATQFAEYIKKHLFPNLYYETSTNGNGIHAYVLINTQRVNQREVRETYKLFQQYLRDIQAVQKFDIQNVEIKGNPFSADWNKQKKLGKENSLLFPKRWLNMGTLAKYPRYKGNLKERLKDYQIGIKQLWMMAKQKVDGYEEIKDELNQLTDKQRAIRYKKRPSSCSSQKLNIGRKIICSDVRKRCFKIAKKLGVEIPEMAEGKRIEKDDFDYFLLLLEYFTLDQKLNPDSQNKEGDLPFNSFQNLWNAAYRAGDFKRAFNASRYKAIKRFFTDIGMINWIDETYCYVTHICCKWNGEDHLMAMLCPDLYCERIKNYTLTISKNENEYKRPFLGVVSTLVIRFAGNKARQLLPRHYQMLPFIIQAA